MRRAYPDLQRALSSWVLLLALTFGGCNEEPDQLPLCTGAEHCAGVPLDGAFEELVGRWELLSILPYGSVLTYAHNLEIYSDGSFVLDNDHGIIQAGCFDSVMQVLPDDTVGLNYYSSVELACTNKEYLSEGNYRIILVDDNRLRITGYFIFSAAPTHSSGLWYQRIY